MAYIGQLLLNSINGVKPEFNFAHTFDGWNDMYTKTEPSPRLRLSREPRTGTAVKRLREAKAEWLTHSHSAMYYARAVRTQHKDRRGKDRIFRAVADPTRRNILERLHERELTVLELWEPFRITQPSLSKHLAVLRRSGLISARRSGRHRYYRLSTEPLDQIAAWVAQFRDVRDPSGHVWRLTEMNPRKDK